jgi:hypothetical protein
VSKRGEAWFVHRWIRQLPLLVAVLMVGCVEPSRAEGPARQPVRAHDRGATAERVEAWLATDGRPRRLSPSESLDAGAQVQLRYRASGKRWVTFAGVDGAGLVEVYGTTPTAADTSSWQPAPFSLILDDAPGFQRLLVLFTDAPPPPDEVVEAIGAGRTPQGAEVSSMVIPKHSERR